MGILTIDKAVFFGRNGEEVGKKVIPVIHKRDHFNFGQKSFVIDLKNCSYFDKWGLIWNTRYYFYNLENLFPLKIEQSINPQIDSDFLNVQLENKVARDLSRTGGNFLQNLLSPRNIIIGVILAFVIYVLATGQWKKLLGI